MTKLETIAKRIGQIGNEIAALKSQREVNLQHCNGSDDEDFNASINKSNYDNCMTAAYQRSRSDREEAAIESEYGYAGFDSYLSFGEILNDYGCKNCKGAYENKQAIGKLKQERGRLVGSISKIGKSL